MRLAALLALTLMAAGCGDRRSFDERFDDTASKIENRAAEVDAELAANEAQANSGNVSDRR